MERDKRGYFPEEFRRWAVTKVESGELSVEEINRDYGIQGHSTVVKWCRRYGTKQYPVGPQRASAERASPEERKIHVLRSQVKVLERELKEARLKQATLESLVEVAEQRYGIVVKKNYGGRR